MKQTPTIKKAGGCCASYRVRLVGQRWRQQLAYWRDAVRVLSREMIRRIIRRVFCLVWRRSPTLRTHNPLTSNSRAMSFRTGSVRCRTYRGSAIRRRCANRKLSTRTARRRALTRATSSENPFRRPLATRRSGSAADLAPMTRPRIPDCRT
jgi:hypothetical protein